MRESHARRYDELDHIANEDLIDAGYGNLVPDAPAPTPDDEGYWQAVEADTNIVPFPTIHTDEPAPRDRPDTTPQVEQTQDVEPEETPEVRRSEADEKPAKQRLLVRTVPATAIGSPRVAQIATGLSAAPMLKIGLSGWVLPAGVALAALLCWASVEVVRRTTPDVGEGYDAVGVRPPALLTRVRFGLVLCGTAALCLPPVLGWAVVAVVVSNWCSRFGQPARKIETVPA